MRACCFLAVDSVPFSATARSQTDNAEEGSDEGKEELDDEAYIEVSCRFLGCWCVTQHLEVWFHGWITMQLVDRHFEVWPNSWMVRSWRRGQWTICRF